MTRYARLLLTYFKINFKSLAIYDFDFYFSIIGMMIQNLINVAALRFLYLLVPTIQGYTFTELLTTYAIASTSFAIFRCFFINTLNIADYVRKGKFDGLLVKPVNPLFQLLNESFDEDAWGDLAISVLILTTIAFSSHMPLLIFLLVLLMCCATSLIFLSLTLLGGMVSLLSQGLADLSETVYDFFEFSKYPLSIYNTPLKMILTWFLPLGWVAAIPQSTVIDDGRWYFAILVVGISVALFTLVYQLWRLFLVKYQSTGT